MSVSKQACAVFADNSPPSPPAPVCAQPTCRPARLDGALRGLQGPELEVALAPPDEDEAPAVLTLAKAIITTPGSGWKGRLLSARRSPGGGKRRSQNSFSGLRRVGRCVLLPCDVFFDDDSMRYSPLLDCSTPYAMLSTRVRGCRGALNAACRQRGTSRTAIHHLI